MIEAVLQIASEKYYSCELTRKIPVRINLVTINGSEGFGIIESLNGTEAPLRKYTKFMKRSSSILDIEILHKSELQYWTRAVHSVDGASIHDTILENSCMTKLPIIISRGSQYHTILAPSQEEFSQLFDNLKERFTSVKIEKLRRYPSGISAPVITSKQMDAVLLAYARGYYEIPRKCEIQQIAKEVGIKRVAMQERLRRAQRTIMKEFVQEYNL